MSRYFTKRKAHIHWRQRYAQTTRTEAFNTFEDFCFAQRERIEKLTKRAWHRVNYERNDVCQHPLTCGRPKLEQYCAIERHGQTLGFSQPTAYRPHAEKILL